MALAAFQLAFILASIPGTLANRMIPLTHELEEDSLFEAIHRVRIDEDRNGLDSSTFLHAGNIYNAPNCIDGLTIPRPLSCYHASCNGYYIPGPYGAAVAQKKVFWSKLSIFTVPLGPGLGASPFQVMEEMFSDSVTGRDTDELYRNALDPKRSTPRAHLAMQWWVLPIAERLYKRTRASLYLDWCDERATAVNRQFAQDSPNATEWTEDHKTKVKRILSAAAEQCTVFVGTKQAARSEWCQAEEEGAHMNPKVKKGFMNIPNFDNITNALNKLEYYEPDIDTIVEVLDSAISDAA